MKQGKDQAETPGTGGAPSPSVPVPSPSSTPTPETPKPNEPKPHPSDRNLPPKADDLKAVADTVAKAAPAPNKEAIDRTNAKAETPPPGGPKAPPKGGRPPGYSPKLKAEVEAQAVKDQCRRAGEGSAMCVLGVFRLAFGPEWQADTPEEIETFKAGWADTYEAYGWHESPKWFPMVAATGAFAYKRLSRPDTRTRIQKAKEGLAAWYAKKKVQPKAVP